MSELKQLNKYSINLRTLKDIGFNPHGQDMAFPEYVKELKEAAKEWVLELQKSAHGNSYVEEEMEAKIEWIIEFFNLEGEDK